jgi:hypothetical protein
MVLYKYMKSLGNDVHNLSINAHVQSKIYREFYHNIVYIPNEGHHIRIKK